jgi:hypothetical protein
VVVVLRLCVLLCPTALLLLLSCGRDAPADWTGYHYRDVIVIVIVMVIIVCFDEYKP